MKRNSKNLINVFSGWQKLRDSRHATVQVPNQLTVKEFARLRCGMMKEKESKHSVKTSYPGAPMLPFIELGDRVAAYKSDQDQVLSDIIQAQGFIPFAEYLTLPIREGQALPPSRNWGVS